MFFDTLPFPNITAKDAEERSKQTVDYLIQFKEELEFILNAIARGEYGSITTKPTQVVETHVVSTSRNELTVAEVINSAAFKGAIDSVQENINDVGKDVDEARKEIAIVENAIPKEYLVRAEQTYVSSEPGGINLYSVTDAGGQVKALEVKNGKTPKVTLSVNFENGNLEYTTS